MSGSSKKATYVFGCTRIATAVWCHVVLVVASLDYNRTSVYMERNMRYVTMCCKVCRRIKKVVDVDGSLNYAAQKAHFSCY